MLVASSFFFTISTSRVMVTVSPIILSPAGEGVGHVDDAEILAIDFGGGGGAAARAAHYLDGLGRAGHVEGDFFGDAVDCEGFTSLFGDAVACRPQFYVDWKRPDGGKFGYVRRNDRF